MLLCNHVMPQYVFDLILARMHEDMLASNIAREGFLHIVMIARLWKLHEALPSKSNDPSNLLG